MQRKRYWSEEKIVAYMQSERQENCTVTLVSKKVKGIPMMVCGAMQRKDTDNR